MENESLNIQGYDNQMKSLKTIRSVVGFVLILILGVSSPVLSEEPEQLSAEDEVGLDIREPMEGFSASDELLLFTDIPIVISASRQKQPINQLSVPVSTLSADDIHFSGVTNLAELLQFVPGVDVLQLDRNHYAVGIRGMHSMAADRVLTLIDGRNAGDSITGAPDFTRLPLFMEDIKQVEIVRGPGSAAWGANALNGAFNIITKTPEETQGWYLGSTWNHFGDNYSHLRWGDTAGKWSWRASFGYEKYESSDDAVDDDNFYTLDYSRNRRMDIRAIYKASEETTVDMGTGYFQAFRGPIAQDILAAGVEGVGHWYNSRSYIKVSHDFNEDVNGYLQVYTNYDKTDDIALWDYHSLENVFESQLQIKKDAHELTLGTNIKWQRYTMTRQVDTFWDFEDAPFDEYTAGLFVVDRWNITDRWALEGQLRGDYYTGTGADWAGRLSSIYALDEDHNQVLRVSAAKAYRAMLIDMREGQLRRFLIFPPDFYAYQVHKTEDLENEETWSFEVGYHAKLNEMFTLRVDTYYQQYYDLVGILHSPDVVPVNIGFAMDEDATGWGAETELTMNLKKGTVGLWYAYHGFDEEYKNQSIRGFLPPEHNIGLTGRYKLTDHLTANANYRYTDITGGDKITITSIDSSCRLDLAMTYEIPEIQSEFQFGVMNLLNRVNHPVDGVLASQLHEMPGRAWFAHFQVAF